MQTTYTVYDDLMKSSVENHGIQTIGQFMVSTLAAKSITQLLLKLCIQEIKEKQLLKHTPSFVCADFIHLLGNLVTQSFPDFGTNKPESIPQEDPSKMVKIEKDNLSPKQLPSQNPQVVKDLPENLSNVGSVRLSLTKRNSFLNRKASQISQSCVGASSQKGNVHNNVSLKPKQSGTQKTAKSSSIKKNSLQNFTSLGEPQHQDSHVTHLRSIVQFQHKEKEKEIQIHNQRLKEDQQKVNHFHKKFGQKSSFTFDFDGEAVGSQIRKDGKINYHAMRVGVKMLQKKYRTIYKHLDDPNHCNQSVIKTRSIKAKQSLNQSIDLLNSSAQIPIFKGQQKSYIHQMNPAKLKIQDYKRLYGKKFSRHDKNYITIDMSSVFEKKKTEEDLFTSKKHLTDSLSVNKRRNSSVNKQYSSRKLTLPKLQGKYNVLDRYQQF